MNSLAANYLAGPNSKKKKNLAALALGKNDIFVASVINQKIVNQSAQQVLVAIAAQVLFVIEAQFGFATNLDNDVIKT